MAMFNGYPASYQQMTLPQWQNQYQQPVIQQPLQQIQPTMNNTIVWVKTQKEAEDYLVAPNNSMVFMDEAMTHLYMKSADQFGRPSFRSKLLTDDTPKQPSEARSETKTDDADKYLTKEEFAKWVDDTLEKRLSELRQKPHNNNRQEKRDNNNA